MLLTEALRATESIKGWLRTNEQSLLYDLAKASPKGGTIVELGSWMGRSTIMLAAGSQAGPGATVFAVDLFANIGETKDQYAPHLGDDPSEYFPRFEANIREAGVESVVVPIRSETVAAGLGWTGSPIDLLFIDADHSYNGVRGDFLSWVSHCKPGGRVAFHDYFSRDQNGVRQFVDQLLAAGVITDIDFADSILHGRLVEVDASKIESRIPAGPSKRDLSLFRPGRERKARHDFAIEQGWYQFSVQKDRSSAIANGLTAVRWMPWKGDGWRLLVCAIIKPIPAPSS
jgi:predicted O-methyltransferase YrrM